MSVVFMESDPERRNVTENNGIIVIQDIDDDITANVNIQPLALIEYPEEEGEI